MFRLRQRVFAHDDAGFGVIRDWTSESLGEHIYYKSRFLARRSYYIGYSLFTPGILRSHTPVDYPASLLQLLAIFVAVESTSVMAATFESLELYADGCDILPELEYDGWDEIDPQLKSVSTEVGHLE